MSYSKVPAGKDLPNDIYVAIEIPANHAPIKYEIDHDTDCLFVDRFMATPIERHRGVVRFCLYLRQPGAVICAACAGHE